MANSGFLVTNAGLAAAAAATPEGPYIHIASFSVGSAYGYTPQQTQTALQGTVLYTGTPSGYTVVNTNTVEIDLTMSTAVGNFNFGEIGLYLDDGTLFAVCTWDAPQEKTRAISTNAGNMWIIRSLLTLAQAEAIVQVSLGNTQAILEVPNFSSLAAPVNVTGGGNIGIVHQLNSFGKPVLVYRNNDTDWGLNDYNRWLIGATTDRGATITANNLTHPAIAGLGLAPYFPRTDSKFIVKLPSGYIATIASVNGSTITFGAPVPVGLSGAFSIWGDETIRDLNQDNEISAINTQINTINQELTVLMQAAYPIGSVYINAQSSANPAQLLGIGTWTALGAGRVLLGAGQGNDGTFTPAPFAGGSVGGTYGPALLNHTHAITDPGHVHSYGYSGYNNGPRLDGVGDGGSSLTSSSGSTGASSTGITQTNYTQSGQQNTGNMQPYLCVWMWQRTL